MKSALKWTLAIVLLSVAFAGCGKDDEQTDPKNIKPGQQIQPGQLDKQQIESVSNRWFAEAMEARDKGNWDEAEKKFLDTFREFPKTWAGRMSALEVGRRLAETPGREKQALECLEAGLAVVAGADDERRVKQQIAALRRKLTTGPVGGSNNAKHNFPLKYTVRRGDTLAGIAQKYGLRHPDYGWQYEVLYFANWNDSALRKYDRIKPGDVLTIDNEMPVIMVDKSDFTLQLQYKGQTKMRFKVGIGKTESETPTGTFVITEKVKNPPFKEHAYGHPENIVGKYWLAFKNTAEHQGYGIHGTQYPESIGHKSSDGCVRMTNEDITEMQRYVPRGTKVTIQE